MKGFIYLLEISVALILMLVVIGSISSYKTKESWERVELIATGNNIVKTLKNGDVLEVLNGNFSKIESLIQPNVNFGLKIKGIPKSNISVGCVNYCGFVEELLTPTYVNGRRVNFTVKYFDINSLNYIPSSYDAVVFVNYTDYSLRKSNITNYLNKGGVLIGINNTYSNSNQDFNDIFGLNSIGSTSSNYFHFSNYNPSIDSIEKYFLGIGFFVNTTVIYWNPTKRGGYLTLWGEPRNLNLSSSGMIDIENKTSDEGLMKNIPEGGIFKLKGPDNIFYTFKVKKIFWDNEVIIQPLNTSFVFRDISELNVTGKINIVALPGGQAEMTSNNTAIWISNFLCSFYDDYKNLVKAAITSRVNNWYSKEIDSNKEYVAISAFYPLCCDMAETAELTFYLWYKI